MNWLISLLNRVTQSAPLEWEDEEDDEEDEEEVDVTIKAEGDAYYQPDSEEAFKEIVNACMNSWQAIFIHTHQRLPNYDELQSQLLVTQFSLNEVNELSQSLYCVADSVCEDEGYASPPPWALKIARGAVMEYLTGTLTMVNTCIKEHEPVDDEDG